MTRPKNSRPVTELDVAFNAYGRTIYVQEWENASGKPKIWYEYNRQDVLMRYERRTTGIFGTRVGKTRYVKCSAINDPRDWKPDDDPATPSQQSYIEPCQNRPARSRLQRPC